MTSAPPPSSQPVPSTTRAARRWTHGSLSYSAGGLAALFLVLLIGDFAWSVKERAAIPVAQVLLKQLEASNLFVALVVGSLPWGLSMLLAPFIAIRSDRHRGRWGRRIPYLLAPTPLLMLGLVGMAYTPECGAFVHGLLGSTSPGLRICKLGWFSVMWTAFEVASVTANAVFGGLVADVVPGSLTGRFYGMFRAVSLLAGIIFTYQVVGHAEQFFTEIFIGIALIYGLGFGLMCWLVREGQYPPARGAEHADQASESETRRYMRECFSHRFYVGLFVAMMLGLISFNPVNSFGVFYAKQIGLGLDGYGKALALTYTCSLILALPVGWLADRWHPLRVGLACIALYAAMMVPAGLLVKSATQFSIAFVLHGVFSGLFVTGTAAIGQYLYPRERFAQFQSAANILAALGYTLVPPLVGAWLDLTGQHYQHTFVASGLLATASALIFLWLLGPFNALGGAKNYQPPGGLRSQAPFAPEVAIGSQGSSTRLNKRF